MTGRNPLVKRMIRKHYYAEPTSTVAGEYLHLRSSGAPALLLSGRKWTSPRDNVQHLDGTAEAQCRGGPIPAPLVHFAGDDCCGGDSKLGIIPQGVRGSPLLGDLQGRCRGLLGFRQFAA